jgi:F-type H+-transporting ATPase subunit c
MDPIAFKYLGAGIAASGMIGAGIGIGHIFGALLSGIARNPSAKADLMPSAFVGAGFAEALGLFSFLIALLLLFVV